MNVRKEGTFTCIMVYPFLHCLARNVDLREAFRVAGFSTDPEREVFHTLKENALGNIRWVGIYVQFTFLQA